MPLDSEQYVKKLHYKSVEVFRSDCICMRIHFQCLGVMLPKKMTATFPLCRIHRSKSKNRTGIGCRLFSTNANFTKTNNTQSLASANLDEMQTVDFLTTLLFGWKSHIYCATSVFGRFLIMDCPKHLLEHCLIGLFGWIG